MRPEGMPQSRSSRDDGESLDFHTDYAGAEASLEAQLAVARAAGDSETQAGIKKELANYAKMREIEADKASFQSVVGLARARGESALVEALQRAIQQCEKTHDRLGQEGALLFLERTAKKN